MPYNGSGTFTPPGASFPAVPGATISSTKYNAVINDIATGLSTALTKDGQTTATTNLPMGGFKHTSIANATSRDQYAAFGQVQDNTSTWCGTAGGTADLPTLTPTPAIPGYVAGQSFTFKTGAGANTTVVAVAVSGLATKAIQLGGAALAAGDMPANSWFRITYDGAAFQLERFFPLTINTFADNLFRILGSADATKKLAFEVDGLTTATTRTATAPDYDVRIGNMPAGIIMDYAGASVPTGWLECDGSSQLRATYPALFTAIGTTWGAVDGTHFSLPDFRGRARVGKGTGLTAEVVTASSGNGFTVVSNNTKWLTGMPVVWSAFSGFASSGSAGPTYYVVRISATNIRFATTLVLAQAETPDVPISGSGSCTVTYTLTARTLAEIGGNETKAMTATELLSHSHSFANNVLQISAGGNQNGTAANALSPLSGTNSTGGNAAMNIMQPFAITMAIISY